MQCQLIFISFLICFRATHAEPSTLKLSCENTEFRMSEPVSSEITAKLNDDYGNFISVVSYY